MKKIKISKKKATSALILGGLVIAGICSAIIVLSIGSGIQRKIEQKEARSGFIDAPEELVSIYQLNKTTDDYTVQGKISLYGSERYVVRETGTYVFKYAEDCSQQIKDDTRDEIGYRYFDPLDKEERIVEEWEGNTLTITFDFSYRDGVDRMTKTLLRIYENDAPSMRSRTNLLKKEGFVEAKHE